MKIQVLGTGCERCKKLYAQTQKAIAASGLSAELEKVENMADIMKFRVMATPALVVDGKVKAAGRIPETGEIVTWLMNAAAKE